MRPKAWIAGMTDYTGVTLSDILDHLESCRVMLASTIHSLKQKRVKAEEVASSLENLQEVLWYIDYFVDLLQRYQADIERLIKELPAGVCDAHVEIVNQVVQSRDVEDNKCITFKQNEIQRTLTYEEVRPLLDQIYGESRQALIDLHDFSNIAPRLRTFINVKITNPVVELTQTFYGSRGAARKKHDNA